MIPLRDTIPSRTVPVVTHLLVGLNVAAFAVQLMQGARLDLFVERWAFVPAKLFSPSLAGGGTVPLAAVTLVTSMFLHGGLLHLAGNLLYLWIFGDNVEDDLSHVRFTAFYLVTGVAASLAHVWFTFALGDNPFIPSLGASGAISGVMGGYLVLHPHRRVRVIMLRMLTEVPGYVAVGLWFVLQLISAFGVIGLGPEAGGGVAFMAHIGGFVAGVVLVKLFAVGRRQPARARAPW